MSEIIAKEKEVVVPGEILATGMDYLPSNGTYRHGDNIVSSMLGVLRVDGKVLKTMPLSGAYLPMKGDTIIAQVTEILISGWRVDTNSAYSAVLSLKDGSSSYIPHGADLSQYFGIGDYMITKIVNVTSQNLIDITMKGPGLRKLKGGRAIYVNTNKVPRVIGKGGSMVSMIKNCTGCQITVGQNGVIWVQGEPKNEIIAVDTIKKIEAESHIPGLTEKIKQHLEKVTGKKVNQNVV